MRTDPHQRSAAASEKPSSLRAARILATRPGGGEGPEGELCPGDPAGTASCLSALGNLPAATTGLVLRLLRPRR